jgi:tetrahydromethanopterin S-methyltransferase subunit G
MEYESEIDELKKRVDELEKCCEEFRACEIPMGKRVEALEKKA